MFALKGLSVIPTEVGILNSKEANNVDQTPDLRLRGDDQ